MPTYDYLCPQCQHAFEARQSIHDAPGYECPQCHAKAERILSRNVNILFKGGGFYATDSRAKPAPTTSKETPASGVVTAKSPETAKPASDAPKSTPSKPAAGAA